MQVRYKKGKFTHPVYVTPGDTFTCRLTEEYEQGGAKVQREQQVSEEITRSFEISHWVMFWIPGTPTIGGMFGTEDTIRRLRDIFVDPVEIGEDEPLTGWPAG